MLSKIFLDINIVLDMMDSSRLNHSKSLELIEFCVIQDIDLCISEDMLSTIFYINSDKTYTLKFFQQIIKKWNILPFGIDTLESAIEFCMQNQCDLEDALQCMCAKNNNCDILLTSDKKFVDCGISIMGYDSLLKLK